MTDDAGTGFVHYGAGPRGRRLSTLDRHGTQRDPRQPIDADGAYLPTVPLFAGLKVLETEGKKVGRFGPANSAVMDRLI